MSLVVKSPEVYLVFKFVKVGKGNNFKALEKEVKAQDGKVYYPDEETNDVVVLEVLGHTITLALGFGVLISKSRPPKVLSASNIDLQYTEAPHESGDSERLEALEARCEALEKKVKSLESSARKEAGEE